ncbi:FIG00850068: hypothetical protein [Neisseria meningitidis serogroup B]|uniref:Uncharacterized protein n=1 Tax=Neisseria meningitidis serogroup B TaxID=491 RepID=A0A0H5QFD1_NEIMI|nr:FIG00850068: hypothetical protein [Neisseria meningitidis serogroup B]
MKIRRDARSGEPCAEGSDKEGYKDRCGGLSAAFRTLRSEKWGPASSCYRDACVLGGLRLGLGARLPSYFRAETAKSIQT